MKKKNVIDHAGFRLNVGIILSNTRGQLFWGRRLGQDTWQFPQGGLHPSETLQQTMYRELKEEIGLDAQDVSILGCSRRWIYYKLPEQYIRHQIKPTVIGQKQKWFLLRLISPEEKICLNLNHHPEFDSWRWVHYWYPTNHVIYFKREVYRRALQELRGFLHEKQNPTSTTPPSSSLPALNPSPSPSSDLSEQDPEKDTC